MRLFASNTRLLGLITLILVGGFLTTSMAAYLASRDAIEHSISEQALPLTGDILYAGLQKDILHPILISSMMAQDPLVRAWLADPGASDADIGAYLNNIKSKYSTVSSFMGSDRNRKLYQTYGSPIPLVEGAAIDAWFFRLKAKGSASYETNVDIDTEFSPQPTLYINHRVQDGRGTFLGATGVGITLATMNQVLTRYQARYGRNIYFVNDQGRVVLAGARVGNDALPLASRAGIRDIAPAIMNRSTVPTTLAYKHGQADVLVNSRYLPELKWYLVVEQDVGSHIRPLSRIFAVNFGISFGVTLLMLVVTLLTVNRYQRQLQKMATTDALTGLLNRQALTPLFHQLSLVSKRSGKPMSGILFDIDHFKHVNDTLGHVAGDAVIRQVAELAQCVVRESDVVTRWGGEEYLVLLNDCRLAQAMMIAEKLRQRVAAHDFALPSGPITVTISLGVAELDGNDTETGFFTRADVALYGAKRAGRNQSVAAPMLEPPAQLF